MQSKKKEKEEIVFEKKEKAGSFDIGWSTRLRSEEREPASGITPHGRRPNFEHQTMNNKESHVDSEATKTRGPPSDSSRD